MNDAAERDDFVVLVKPTRLLRCVVLCFLCAAILIIRWRGITVLSSSYIGGYEQDPGLYVWLCKHAASGLFASTWFETGAFYPYGKTLAWSDNFILPGLMYGLLYHLVHSEALAYNLVLLVAQLLNGLFTFEVIYALTGDKLSSLFAGVLSLSLLSFEGQLGHPQLQFFFFFPAGILALLYYLQTPRLRYSLQLGLIVVFAFLTSVYYSLFLVFLYAVFFLPLIVLHPHLLNKKLLATLLLGLFLGVVPLVPFVLPYLEVKGIFGSRGLYEAYYFSATSLSLIAPSTLSAFYPVLSRLSHPEAQAFTGFSILLFSLFAFKRVSDAPSTKNPFLIFSVLLTTVLMLSAYSSFNIGFRYACAVSFWAALIFYLYGLKRLGDAERTHNSSFLTNRDILGILLFSALMFFFLSLGPLGNPVKGNLTPGLYSILFYLVPGFNSLRAIGRSCLIATYILTLIYYIVLSHYRNKNVINRFVFAILLLLPLLENYTTTYSLDLPISQPPLFHTIDALPADGSALALPYADKLDSDGSISSWSDFSKLQIYYMNWFQHSRIPIVNGYSGQQSKMMKELPRRVKDFPDEKSLLELSSITGLRYIAVFPQFDSRFNKAVFEGALELYKDSLTLVEKDSAGNYLFEFSAAATLSPNFILKAPGTVSTLSLNLTIPKGCKEEETTLVLRDSESASSPPLATLKLPKELPPTWMDVPLMHSPDPRIIRMSFQTSGCPVRLVGSKSH